MKAQTRTEARVIQILALGLFFVLAFAVLAYRLTTEAGLRGTGLIQRAANIRMMNELEEAVREADSAFSAMILRGDNASRDRFAKAQDAVRRLSGQIRRVDGEWSNDVAAATDDFLIALDALRTSFFEDRLDVLRASMRDGAVDRARDSLVGMLEARKVIEQDRVAADSLESQTATTRLSLGTAAVGAFALGLVAVCGLLLLRDSRRREEAEEALRKSETLLANSQKAANVGSWELDPYTHEIEWSNQSYLIFDRDTRRGAPSYEEFAKLFGDEEFARLEQVLADAITRGADFGVDFRIISERGQEKIVRLMGRPVYDRRGVLIKTAGAVMDVTETRNLEQRLKLLSVVAERSACEIAILDGVGRIIFANEQLCASTERDMSELIGQCPWEVLTGPQTDERATLALVGAIGHQRQDSVEMLAYSKSGRPFWTYCQVTPVFDERGEAAQFVFMATDVTERKITEEQMATQLRLIQTYSEETARQKAELAAANERLEVLASIDGLTGLANHRTFQDRLQSEFVRSRRGGDRVSLLLIDVDHFKQYNDSFGHPAGDEVLRTVARLLREQVRAVDLPARYGGEEFAVILPQTNAEGAITIAERIRAAIEGHAWDHRAVTVSIGIGVAMRSESRQDLIHATDQALYQAKREGRNRAVLADENRQAA